MKIVKSVIFFIATFICFQNILAQSPNPNVIKQIVPNTTSGTVAAINSYSAEIFENLNYTGRSIKMYNDAANNTLPFNISEVSIKVKPGNYILRLTTNCGAEFSRNVLLYLKGGDYQHYSLSRFGQICGLKIEPATTVKVYLNNISTQIHNNDCRKMYGDIAVMVKELGNDSYEKSPVFEGENTFEPINIYHVVYKRESRVNTGLIKEYSAIAHYDQPINSLFNSNPPGLFNMGNPIAVSFWVSIKGLKANKVMVELTSNIGSAHKAGDFDPFQTWDVKMAAPQIFKANIRELPYQPLNGRQREIAAGPYRAISPATAGVADGGANNLHLFRVHCSVEWSAEYEF